MKPLLFGKYCLLERISVGGMAEVFRAKPFDAPDFKGYLALKRILPHLAEDDEFIKMFIDEAKLTVQLTHPNIVRIYELGQFQSSYYILMEFISGRDLLALQKRVRKRREVMSVGQSLYIAREVALGLDYAHRKADANGHPLNIIHRDVSPQNVLVDYRGRVKVIDFGIAKAAVQSTRTQVGVLKGKMGYMSPEQVRGENLDHRSDVFAIGTLVWEMLTNRRLFHGDNEFETMQMVRSARVDPPSTRNPNVPPEVDRIVMGALTEDRNVRYQSAAEFAAVIDGYLQRHPFGAEDLSGWMRHTFAEELAEERQKREQFKEIRTPDDVRRILFGSLQEQPAAAQEEEPEKTEIWDADIIPSADEDLAQFAAQHTVVQAGGFDAAQVDDDASSVIELNVGDIEFAEGGVEVDPSLVDDGEARNGGMAHGVGSTRHPIATQSGVYSGEWNRPVYFQPEPFQAQGTRPDQPAPEDPARQTRKTKIIAAALASMVLVLLATVLFVLLLDVEPEDATAVTGQATLVIDVIPPTGVAVRLDGHALEEAPPITLENMAAGRHVLEVEHPEYQSYRESFEVAPTGLTNLTVELEPLGPGQGTLSVQLPEGQEVELWLDGEKQKVEGAQGNWTLTEGEHLVEALAPQRRPWSKIVQVERDKEVEETVELLPLTRTLEVRAPDGSTVRFDGKRVGKVPVELEEVDPKQIHFLQVTRRGSGGGDWRSALGFPDLGRKTIEIDFDSPPASHDEKDFGWLTVTTGDDWWEVLVDGIETGFKTPILASGKIPVVAGEHVITFRRGTTRHDMNVVVHPRETIVIRQDIDFEWKP